QRWRAWRTRRRGLRPPRRRREGHRQRRGSARLRPSARRRLSRPEPKGRARSGPGRRAQRRVETRRARSNRPGQTAEAERAGGPARSGPWHNGKQSVVRSSRTAISCLRGGEFPYLLPGEKCQGLREGHTLSGSAYGWVYQHQGGRLDTPTGDYSFRNREERPTIARWNRPDPLGFDAGDSNRYRYVKNRPTNGTDPSGLQQGPVNVNSTKYAQDRAKEAAIMRAQEGVRLAQATVASARIAVAAAQLGLNAAK